MRVERAEREPSKALDCNFSRHIRDGNSNRGNWLRSKGERARERMEEKGRRLEKKKESEKWRVQKAGCEFQSV